MNVNFIKWNEEGLCGAACAQMVLHALSVTGTTKAEQTTIWTSIQAHTDAKNPQRSCTNLIYHEYNNMVRDVCTTGGKVVCWETYPNALKATLITLIGSGAKVKVRRTGSETTANNNIKKCLQRGGTPIVLVGKGTHWIVVEGWDDSGTQHVNFLDPAADGPSMVPLDGFGGWNETYMSVNECGTFDNKYVIVEVDP
jgi:hypothetical protein